MRKIEDELRTAISFIEINFFKLVKFSFSKKIFRIRFSI